MDLLDRIHRTSFTGAEFLTWLWYRSDAQEGIFDLTGEAAEMGPIELLFDDKLVVSSLEIDAQENFFKGGHPTSSAEARTALRRGKKASEAKLCLVRGAQEWAFTVKAETLQIAGIRIPAVLSKEDDDQFYERMFLLEQLDKMVKSLFGQFIRLRLSEAWEGEELPKIRAWVAEEV